MTALSWVLVFLALVYAAMLVMRWQDHQIRKTEREMRAYADSTPWTSPQHLRLMSLRPRLRWSRARHRRRTVVQLAARR